MNRKDTIIVAALVNAGILIILFVSALKNKDPKESIATQVEPAMASPSELSYKSDTKAVMGDEVDQVLSQYTQANPLGQQAAAAANPMQVSAQNEVVPVSPSGQAPVDATASGNNFVQDLQAITQGSAAQAPEVVASVDAPSEPAFVEVKVKRGDVLEKIARHHHCSVSEIMKINKLSSTNLKIGQVLKIATKSAGSTKKAATSPEAGVKYYTVKSGDNPWTIAVKNHMKVDELLKLNNMDADKAKKLKPGDQIRIR